MKSMTLTSINEQFMAHRQHCAACRSNGAALCRIGMELILAFHDVIVATSLTEIRAQEAARRKATA
jgi:hypothetical protein